MRHYLAIDPGLATGFAITFYDSEQTPPASDFLTIIMERWDVRADTFSLSPQEDARYIIGCADGFHKLFPMRVDYHEQRPHSRKWADNEKLKALGWYKTGTAGHDNEAARHLAVHLVNNGHQDIMEILV